MPTRFVDEGRVGVVGLISSLIVDNQIIDLNAVCTQTTLSLLFFAAYADRSPYLDVALWMASFGYLGTLVWARFLERGLL